MAPVPREARATRTLPAVTLLGLLQLSSGLKLVVPKQDATSVQAASTGSAATGVFDALQELSSRHEHGKLCMAISGPFMGRLSNTVSMMNAVMRVAHKANARYATDIAFKFPHSYTKWMQQEGLDTLFGHEPSCPGQAARVFNARCDPEKTKKGADGNMRCSVEDMLLNPAAPDEHVADLCGCGQVVFVSSEDMRWDHVFEWTHASLRERYWQGQPARVPVPGEPELQVPGAVPRQAVMHVRLGDVEKNCSARYNLYNCRKRLAVESYVKTVQALLAVLPARCLELSIVTDGQRTSPDIQQILQNLSSTGLPEPRVWATGSLDTASTFHFMAHADVLIYGSSGFGQLAAVFARNETARLGNPQPPGYPAEPFYYLANATQLRTRKDGEMDLSEAIAKVKKNEAIQAYAKECRQRSAQASPQA